MKRFAASLVFLLPLAVSCGRREPGPLALFDFEEDADLDHIFWECPTLLSLSDAWASSGEHSLRCVPAERRYPRVRFRDFPEDWSGYDTLSIDIYSENPETLTVVVRVDDTCAARAYDDRYNGRFVLLPGANRFRVGLDEIAGAPSGRRLDLSEIRLLTIFLREQRRAPVLYIDRIFLE